ncbi:SRPBCC family protein [Nemorincola caseinilytica]|uniref:SRPBCC family protein n=1 Tax=Nemorincola caseinilytica TaxID=2054315 RepID=A0ABP8NFK2_9BACT
MTAEGTYEQQITKTITIAAPAGRVWQALTVPAQMQQWMSQTPIEIETDWREGSPISIRGPWYKTHFENMGRVVAFRPGQRLCYTHLSSLSHLADEPGSYTAIDLVLTEGKDGTELLLTLSNFATEAIYRHVNYYWMVSLAMLKRYVEEGKAW